MQGSQPQTRAPRRSILQRRARLDAAVYADFSYPKVESLERRQLLSGTTIYVDDTASEGANNGTSWANAYTDLNSALSQAQAMNPTPSSPVTIDVAEGTYEPGPSENSLFAMVNDTAIVGGFANGGSPTPDPSANPTFLYGQNINTIVVEAEDVDAGAELNGFVIDNATYSGIYILNSSPTIENCTVNDNGSLTSNTNGGGIDSVDSTTTLLNCVISDNSAGFDGGGIAIEDNSATLENCLIEGDEAANNGGGIYDYLSADVNLINCTVTENTAENGSGGGLASVSGSTTTVVNSIIYGDTQFSGSDVYSTGGTVTATYSDIAGGAEGTGNLNTNPDFNFDGSPEFGLTIDSPCIDAGSNAALPTNDTVDLAGNPRIINGIVDMGAYEFEQAPSFNALNVPGPAVFAVGQENSTTVFTTAFPTATLMETPQLPAGLSFTDNGDGTATIAGIPTASPGVYQVTIIASNGIQPDATRTLPILIGIPPQITSPDMANVTVGQYSSFTVQTTGFPTAQIEDTTDETNGGLPEGMFFQQNIDFGPYPSFGPSDIGTYGQDALTVADFNGDGRPDIAVADYSTGKIQVVLNDGPGNMTIEKYTVGSEPDAIASAYLNLETGDDSNPDPTGRARGIGGDPSTSYDLVVANKGSNNVEIFEGDGAGGFTLFATYSVTAPTAVAIADVNDDEIPDIIVASSVTDKITVFLGVATGGFAAPVTTALEAPISDSPQAIATGDFNDDGNQDVVVAGGDGMTVLLSTGTGSFDTPRYYTAVAQTGYTFTAQSVATGYLGPSDPADIVLAGTGTNDSDVTSRDTNVFYNTGDGLASPSLYYTAHAQGPTLVTIGDLHNDDESDIITSGDGSTGYRILANNGDGTFRYLPITYSVSGGPATDIAVTDFNGDDVPFIVSTQNGFVQAAPVLPANTASIFGTPVGETGYYYAQIEATYSPFTPAKQTLTFYVSTTATIVSANSYTMTTGVYSNYTVFSAGQPTPALSETGALPAGVSFVANGDGTASLLGTPAAGTGGVYDLLITANNGTTPLGTQMFVLTVDQPPTLTSSNATTFTTGVTGAFTVTTSSFPAPAIAESGTLPAGVTFVDNGNGTASLLGTPAAGTGGIYAVTITADNGIAPAGTQTFILTVDQPAAFSSSNSYTFSPDATGSFTITATGFPAPTISESGALPAGVSFIDSGGGFAFIFGMPADSAAGVYDITLSASNGIGGTATQMAVITSDDSPTITSAVNADFIVQSTSAFTITTTGIPMATAISEIGALPAGITFLNEGNGTAMLFGTPATGTTGSYSITLTANNGIAPAGTQNFILTIEQPPVFTSSNAFTFSPNASGTLMVTAVGFPAPIISESGALPTGVSFMPLGAGSGIIYGTPADSAGGVYDVTLTAFNSVGSATLMAVITSDESPTFTSSNNYTISTLGTGSFTIATTSIPNPTIIETGALPTGLTFLDEGNGTAILSGTPAANTAGTYDLTITADNGITPAATQSFVLSVVNAPSITSTGSFTMTTGTAATFTVTTGGLPTPSITETGALPTGVSFVDNGDGTATLAGTPIAGTGGVYDITLTASNGVVPTATQSFTLTVNFAVTFTNSNTGTITVSGTNTNNTAGITVSNGNVIITVDGDSESFPAASANNVNVVLGAGNDSIMVYSGAPPVSINGGAGNDTIGTQTNSDTIDGGAGNNSISASNGTHGDSLVGGTGNDTVMGGGSGSTIFGGRGNNLLMPGSSGESVHGGNGNNVLISASDGGDTLRGGSGSDFILGGGNSGDSIKGGLGLSFAQFNAGDSVTGIYQIIDPPPPDNPSVAMLAVAQDIASTKVKLVGSILKATTSSTGDTVVVSESGTNIIVTVDGTAEDTFPVASVGGIKLSAGGSGGSALTVDSDVVIPATLKGGTGNDSLTGGGGSNVLMGEGGSDTLVGGAGTSLLIPGARGVFAAGTGGADSLVGGAGEAIADLAYYTNPMFLSNDGLADSGDASAGNLFTIAPSVQAIWGGSGSDTIIGASSGMFLSGGTGGHDSIDGTMASDLIAGGTAGKNTVIVGAEPVVLDLRNGLKDSFGGINDPSIDILTLDTIDVELSS